MGGRGKINSWKKGSKYPKPVFVTYNKDHRLIRRDPTWQTYPIFTGILQCFMNLIRGRKSYKIWLCFSFDFHWRWTYPTAGTRWMKPARTHLCWISIQCSNAFLKVGAINRLIIRTVENILIREKSLSEIVLSTLTESGWAREGNAFDCCNQDLTFCQKLVKVMELHWTCCMVRYFSHVKSQNNKLC